MKYILQLQIANFVLMAWVPIPMCLVSEKEEQLVKQNEAQPVSNQQCGRYRWGIVTTSPRKAPEILSTYGRRQFFTETPMF